METNYLKNNKEVYLMTWETNPRKRNENNVVTAVSKNKLREGDVIVGSKVYDNESVKSTYTIKRIIESRKASLRGFNHYKLETEWATKEFENRVTF